MAAITVGSTAENRAGVTFTGYTFVDQNNPSGDDGTLTSVDIYAATALTNTRYGTMHGAGTEYTPRDDETIGNVASGSKQTFSGLDIDVQSGDFSSIFCNGRIDAATSGGLGNYYKSGDQFDAGEQTYVLNSGDIISVEGHGETVSAVTEAYGYVV